VLTHFLPMKALFSVSSHTGLSQVWLLLFRVTVGASMLTHGIPKLQTLLTAPEIQFPDPLGVGPVASMALAVTAEALCSVALILGLLTRLALLPLMFTMGMAFFVIHSGDPFSARELAALYFLVFSTLWVTGPGKWSLDALISRFLK